MQIPVPLASVQAAAPSVTENENTVEPQAYRSGRGGYRSPAGGYTGGNRGGITPGTGTNRNVQRPATGEPVNRAPAAPGSRFGGFFGGLAAGTFLGSLLNPFGFGGYGGGVGGGVSLIGLLFWAVLLYLAYRVIRRWFGGAR